MLKKPGFLMCFIVVAVACSGCHALLPGAGSGKGVVVPEIILTRPASPDHLAYLDIPAGSQPFSLNEVKARLVVIELFNMYCPHCQREAPRVNALFELIQSRGLQDKIKIIGLAGRNSDFEIKLFQEKYSVPFPLFSDPDFTNTHKLITEVQTPTFFVLNMTKPGKRRVVYSQAGGFVSPEDFLDTILTTTKLN